MFNQKQRCANIVLFTIVAFSAGSIGPAESTNAWIDDSTQRRLSYQRIAGYTPETLVTSENAIDLDQKEFIAQLSLATANGYEMAMRIYNEGAFTEPIAHVNLTSPLTQVLMIGDKVVGSSEGYTREIRGSIIDNYPKGTRAIRVKYDENEIQSSFVGCQVAANPNPKFTGCFASDGLLTVSGYTRSISYNYNQSSDNLSQKSIARFSTEARLNMELCEGCPYNDYIKFRDYYGSGNYADLWIRSAYEGKQTIFSHGNADFSTYGHAGKFEAMTKASAYMAIFMSCIRKMEDGLHNCERKKVDDGGVHAWDEAVALYTGSLEGSEGSGDGVLMYNLADMRCQNFKTCGTDSNSARGTSNVNLQVFDEFRVGQAKLKQRDCSGARSNKARIVQLMTVPLIQGTLRYAYYQGTGELTTESAEAEGATLAAAVLPFVYDCGDEGKKNAAIIYANMKTRHNPTDFKQVKSAFEQSYQCLGITCADVGGVWDTFGNQYRDGAKPCTGNVISSNVKETNDSRNTGLVLGLTLGGASCVLLIVMLSSFLGRKAAPIPAITPPSEIL